MRKDDILIYEQAAIVFQLSFLIKPYQRCTFTAAIKGTSPGTPNSRPGHRVVHRINALMCAFGCAGRWRRMR
jgi:hypothetical protein